MTTWQSLLYCAAADVTLDRIKNLVALTGTEPVTVDFKEGGRTGTIAECAAAMANAQGGLIFVGITDQGRDLVGVPREAMAHVADVLATRLESPDWMPEMIEVPLGDDKPGRYVLVIRVNRDTAPRPVFVQDRGGRFWAPVRMPGSTRQATRDELYALFTEPGLGEMPDDQWDFHRPDIPRGEGGDRDSAVDVILLSGLHVPVGSVALGRPLSQRAVRELGTSLDGSVLARVLFGLTGRSQADVDGFHPEGQANRSNIATLVWRLQPPAPVPFEMTARIEVPGHYGHSHVGALELTVTVVSRLTAWLNAGRSSIPPPPMRRRLEVEEWAAVLDSVVATLTTPELVGIVADLAAVDPITIRQPRVLHVVSGPPMSDLLPPLTPVRGGGESHGAHMLADPALDLSEPTERAEQVDRWLNQIGSDAGLLGMEDLVEKIRGRAGG
ncbi:MAG TPA: RNA-binding domain-containing protein [Streptosporangiaceae bacterium]